MAGTQARPCSSFITTGWSSEAAGRAGAWSGQEPLSLAGEEEKIKLTGEGGVRKDSGVLPRDLRRPRTGSLDDITAVNPSIKVITFS